MWRMRSLQICQRKLTGCVIHKAEFRCHMSLYPDNVYVVPTIARSYAIAECNARCSTWRFLPFAQALVRWWQRHRIISGASLEDGIYIWWCVFVNNQFRMLEAGLVEVPGDLFDVFGQQLEGIGKMLMCLDNMTSGHYTSRIWCIFEVFVACQRPVGHTWRIGHMFCNLRCCFIAPQISHKLTFFRAKNL